ncbi:hypothetical protein CTA2_11284 [Colletotrichum tanaceti]|nr:hypothetical protein CTA2_11284 [Colletotrichum tanaceti]
MLDRILARMWYERNLPDDDEYSGDRRRALRVAVRKAGAPMTTVVYEIQLALSSRPEWADWYRHVFETGSRREHMRRFFQEKGEGSRGKVPSNKKIAIRSREFRTWRVRDFDHRRSKSKYRRNGLFWLSEGRAPSD